MVRMPFLLTAAVFVLSLLATFGLWQYTRNQAEYALSTDFAFRVRQTARRIEQRMATYEQAARATQAFLLGTANVRREDFRLFVESLRLKEKFPGIQGLALAEAIPKASLAEHLRRIRQEGLPEYSLYPMEDRDYYSSIIQIEPFTGLNLRALGYDMLTDPIRRAAMELARDTGQAAASGKVKLVQENGQKEQTGLVMYLPVYKRNTAIGTVEERRKNLIAWIGAPFRMNDLMAGLGGERSDDLMLTIYDGDVITEDSVLYQSADSMSELRGHRLFASKQKIAVAGRPWTLDIRSSPTYETRIDQDKPRIVGLAGLATSFLLALLVWTLASARKRALTIAMTMTQKLRETNIELASKQKRFSVILDNTHDAFVALDRKGCITEWNAKAEFIFGWSKSEAIGKDLAALIIPAELHSAHRAGFSRFSLTGESMLIKRVVEVEGLHRSGRLIPLELAIAGVPEESGVVVSAFIRDISERKEAARKEAERTQALEEARTALQHSQRLEAVGKLTGGVAHDFNNVLQIISGNIQILEHLYTHEDRLKGRLESMSRAVERGSKLSAHLLAFARRQPLQPSVLNLSQIINDLDDLLRRALGENFELETVVADHLWNTSVDRSQLENVLLNLAINSRDAMPDGGKLVIAMSNKILDIDYVKSHPETLPGEYVLVAMSDNGTGMTEDIIAKAFEPFFTTKRPGEGTGLGLSMAYGFVKQSGGHIRIRSQVGQGTTVEIYLPRSTAVETKALKRDIQPISGGNETILVVEDDFGVQNTVVTILEELGYHIITADNGKDALDIIRGGLQADLLFTDVVMPGSITSTELAREAKSILPNLAILFTSGYTHNELVRGGRLNEGVQLLSKPYRRAELAAKIRLVLTDEKAKPTSLTGPSS